MLEENRKPLPDVECLKYHGTTEKPDIKIFVSHRIDVDSATVDNPMFIPVRCGAELDNNPNPVILGDNTGDNISEKRFSYCELTVQYWAWKNVKADYYGLCHYRRYLSFADDQVALSDGEHDAGCIKEKRITPETIARHNLDEESMREIIEKYDVVAFKPLHLPDYGADSNYTAMKRSPDYHVITDVDLMLRVIDKRYPEIAPYAHKYFAGKKSWVYNCYIMKAAYFERYCQFLFDVLSEVESQLNCEHYTVTQYRTPGVLGERLWGIFYTYLCSTEKNLKTLERPIVFFQDTQRNELDISYQPEKKLLVSNFNNNYFPIFTVFLTSLLENVSPDKEYEYVIFSSDITKENKELAESLTNQYPNFHISYYDPSWMFDGISLFVNNSVYTKEMYYRLIVPYVFVDWKKAVVLDVDAICKRDVAELVDIDVEGYFAAGVCDVVYQGWLNGYRADQFYYAKKVLRMKDPYQYINTGVILMNLEEIREAYSLNYILTFVNNHQFDVFEQDTINSLFSGKIKHIDPRWNLFSYTNAGIEECIKLAPHEKYFAYHEARKDPYIIHYAAHPKPWQCIKGDLGEDFWTVARRSPLYEPILLKACMSANGNAVTSQSGNLNVPLARRKQSRARDVADLIMPVGSKRRAFAKFLMPKGSPQWNILKRFYRKFDKK